jgi:hypothetical protein
LLLAPCAERLEIALAGAPDPVYVTEFSRTHVGRLSAATVKENRDEADQYALASHLAVPDVTTDCGVVDGDWVLIDAVSKGKRFVLSASNPESCSADAAKLVSELLHEVTEPSR